MRTPEPSSSSADLDQHQAYFIEMNPIQVEHTVTENHGIDLRSQF